MASTDAGGAGWTTFWRQVAQNRARGWSWSGFERSVLFLNQGDSRFIDVAPVLGADQVSDGRGLAAGDIDGDGDLDLVGTCSRTHPHAYVLRNDVRSRAHFVEIELHPSAARSAAGAKLLLTAGGRTQRRDVALGSGLLAQHSLVQHFGLGESHQIDRLEIRWPDGELQTRELPSVDCKFVIRQDAQAVVFHGLEPRNYNGTFRLPAIEWDGLPDTLQLLDKPWARLPKVTLTDLEGRAHSLGAPGAAPDAEGPFQLLNLWTTWCAGCRREQPALDAAHELPHTDLSVLGLCLDEEGDGALVRQAALDWGITYPIVHLRGVQRSRLLPRLEALVSEGGEIPLPCSLLIAPTGQVVAISRGPLEIERLEMFLTTLPLE